MIIQIFFLSIFFSDKSTTLLQLFIMKLHEMRETSTHNTDISEEIRRMLYDKSLIEKVQRQLEKEERVESFIEDLKNDITLGESIDKWQDLLNACRFDNEDAIKKEVFTKTSILANILNPKLKGHKLSTDVIAQAKLSMMIMLKSSDEFRVFSNYMKNEDIFSNNSLVDQDSEIVWDIVSGISPQLSSLAMVDLE